jgi:hypothetical protein
MKEIRISKSLSFGGIALGATAIGAFAIGALAIGAFAIGRLVIRRVVVESAKLRYFEIEDLTVTRLHAAEITVSDSLKLPGSDVSRDISS